MRSGMVYSGFNTGEAFLRLLSVLACLMDDMINQVSSITERTANSAMYFTSPKQKYERAALEPQNPQVKGASVEGGVKAIDLQAYVREANEDAERIWNSIYRSIQQLQQEIKEHPWEHDEMRKKSLTSSCLHQDVLAVSLEQWASMAVASPKTSFGRTVLAFGMELHLETASSWFWRSDEDKIPINGRLRVLDFATEIKKAAGGLFDWIHTGLTHLPQYESPSTRGLVFIQIPPRWVPGTTEIRSLLPGAMDIWQAHGVASDRCDEGGYGYFQLAGTGRCYVSCLQHSAASLPSEVTCHPPA